MKAQGREYVEEVEVADRQQTIHLSYTFRIACLE